MMRLAGVLGSRLTYLIGYYEPWSSFIAPTHVHIAGAGQAKVNLLGPDDARELVFSVGIKRADMRRLLAEVALRRDALLTEWERIHGRHD